MNDGVGAWHALPVLRKQDLFSYKQALSETIDFGRDISLPYRGAVLYRGCGAGSAVPRTAGDGCPYSIYRRCGVFIGGADRAVGAAGGGMTPLRVPGMVHLRLGVPRDDEGIVPYRTQ